MDDSPHKNDCDPFRRVTQDLSVSPVYDAIYWDPQEKYQWKNKSPPALDSVKVYEAHVGISTPEGRVGTYKEFTVNVLPRIKALGYNVIQMSKNIRILYQSTVLSFILISRT